MIFGSGTWMFPRVIRCVNSVTNHTTLKTLMSGRNTNYVIKDPRPQLYVCRFQHHEAAGIHDAASTSESIEMPLYPEHIRTTCFQKLLLSVGSSLMAISDPYRDDMVAVFGETTGHCALRSIHEKMSSDPEGSEILRQRPRINSNTIDVQYLETLEPGTFGAEYADFLRRNNVSPDTRQPVHFVDDPDLAYVMQRYREVHDLVHTLLGMPTNMIGEVAVKWVEAFQTGLPMCITGAVFGPVRFSKKQRQRYLSTYLPWAIQCGVRSKFFMNVYFERRWEQPIDDLRKELNILQPPTIK